MKFYRWTVVSAVVFGIVPTMRAQYCGVIQASGYTTYCSATGPQGPCSQAYYKQQIEVIDGGYEIQGGFISCCATNQPYYYYQGGTCHYAELKKPEMQKRLEMLAQNKTVLVAACNGRYDTYDPHDATDQPKLPVINLDTAKKMDLGL